MKVLVTGGTGFIGSHTCVELLSAGHDVIIADNLSNSKAETADAIRKLSGRPVEFHEMDLRDRNKLRQLFAGSPIDAVIHFAGYKSVPESRQKPVEYYNNNIISTLTLCEVMKETGCRRLVFSSSATVYGNEGKAPFREEMPVSATNPYGNTKIMIEQILTDQAAADPQWSICLLRYFNPIGAHPSGLIGEDPNGIPNNLLPYVSQVAAGLRSEILIYGNDYDTPDGTGIRDYIHVVDLAVGHLSALKHIENHKGVETVNLGTGRGTSVLEMIRAYSEACGKDLPYRIAPRREGDIAVCYADTQKAREVFGWETQRGLAEMCRDSWNFARKRYTQPAAV